MNVPAAQRVTWQLRSAGSEMEMVAFTTSHAGPTGRMSDVSALEGLIAAVPDLRVLAPAPEAVITDWMSRRGSAAFAVAYPEATDQVAAVLGWAAQTGTKVVVQGGNTGLVGGSLPAAPEQLILNLTHLVGTSDLDTTNGAITVAAGVTLGDLQRAVARSGWVYGVDLAARDSATIGGTIATNAGGMRVIQHGDTRAQLLGLEWVRADGQVISDLRGLPKDNTGYALGQLLCGCEGSLGVITRARLRLRPPPGPSVLWAVAADTLADAAAVISGLRRTGIRLLAAEVVDGASLAGLGSAHDRTWPLRSAAYGLLIEGEVGADDPRAEVVMGDRDVVVATDRTSASGLWWFREEQAAFWTAAGEGHKFDVSLPHEHADAAVEVIRRRLRDQPGVTSIGLFGHLNEGNLHLQVLAPHRLAPGIASVVLSEVARVGGSISAEHGIGRDKTAFLGLRRSRQEISVMWRIKDALDPAGLLNPGVLLPERSVRPELRSS